LKNEAAIFLLALQFLTRLPVPSGQIYSPERLAASIKYYPLVGAIVGALCAAVYWAADIVFPGAIPALLAIAAGLLITGAFHEDGLADTFDGVGGGVAREQSLIIMKDSRIGTYGAAALIMAFALKAGALAITPALLACSALIVAHSLSRLSSVLVIATSRYVRDEGAAKPVANSASTQSLLVAFGSGLLLLAIWLFFWPASSLLCAGLGLCAGHVAMRLFFERKLGGYTGDTLGAVQQASEIGFYLGLAAWI